MALHGIFQDSLHGQIETEDPSMGSPWLRAGVRLCLSMEKPVPVSTHYKENHGAPGTSGWREYKPLFFHRSTHR